MQRSIERILTTFDITASLIVDAVLRSGPATSRVTPAHVTAQGPPRWVTV